MTQPTIKIRNAVKRAKKPQNKPSNPAYDAYQKYIKSKGFRELRDKVLERDGYRCKFCGRTIEEIEGSKISLQAHHSSYENLGKCNEEEMNDIIICCSVCHKNCHSAPSNLRRFTDKTPILENIKQNPLHLCRINEEELKNKTYGKIKN